MFCSFNWRNVCRCVAALVIATIVQPLAPQRRVDPDVPANIRTSQFYSASGEICRIRVVDCTERRNRNSEKMVHAAVDLLAPRADRGAEEKERGARNIGNCTNLSREEYENLSILFDDDACSNSSAIITWKGRVCAVEESLVKTDLCGDEFARFVSHQMDEAARLNSLASALEDQASRQTDSKLKEPLMQYARVLRLQATGIKNSVDELTKKRTDALRMEDLLR